MADILDNVDAGLLGRVDRAVSELGTTRAALVERALNHYLSHVAELDLGAAAGTVARAGEVDWPAVKRTLIAAHCPYPSCPHADDCPIELCPL
jgi:hypothetical protein